MSSLKDAFICDGIRTPFGKYGGALSEIRVDDLAALPLRELLKRNPSLPAEAVDEVILGCANQSGEDNRNVARMALLLAGLPFSVPGMTINRLCASGLEAIAIAARQIRLGEADVILAGGVEGMTRSPFVIGKSESAFSRAPRIEDTTMGWRFINPRLAESYGVETMPQTGENVAQDFKISRADQDAFSLRSQQRYFKAKEKNIFADEIMPVSLTLKKGQSEETLIKDDEHPRTTSLEALAKLKPIVSKDGTITAGNASGINDGAVGLLIASAEAIKKYNLKPIAKIIATAAVGVEPRIMGIGPVTAVKKVLQQTGLKLKDIELIELNEAFASQSLAVLRQLEIADDAEHVNPHGGAIALGHPLGATGARLVLTASLEMKRRKAKYALCTLCVGVGQGSALLLERV